VAGQIVGVDARLVVVAVELRVGAELEQVAVAGEILGQQQQVVAFLVQLAVAAAFPAKIPGDCSSEPVRASGPVIP